MSISGKEPTCQGSRLKQQIQSQGWEDPLVRKWQPTPDSCLGNPMDRGAWWATVLSEANSWAQLACIHMHALIFTTINGINIYKPASLKYSANKNFYNSGNF